ncbi:hypothetical protein B9T31_15965 [Acinetobacter sp. ANC 4558]|uniref:hypothetical protein n=1 Tax=Acinetobacter sp. ANC 4558 TaxID=1977876 RepID=UPI000A352CF4|nr:hypothetical protein [Acinetobacter sp. ANC 4558]OTG80796.1 hypothetical protein B9T31_15965 [Acinetobacter sp. ANC 4558]
MSIAQVIPFKKTSQPKQEAGKNMYSDKFTNGHVMSSRLYRKEVRPFLSNAARNVYAELEDRINGHLKESDFVSHSQLQGGELPGSKKLSSKTVDVGIKELLELGVISIIAIGKQGIKKYRINEISLVNHFTKESTLLGKVVKESTLLSESNHFTKESETTLLRKDTIDNKNLLDIKKRTSLADNSDSNIFLDSIEYHREDQKIYTLRELANVYSVQNDFTEQAKKQNPNFADDFILSELRNFAQWSKMREKTTAQGWMNYWIYRIQKLKSPKPTTAKPKSTELSNSQIEYFASKLAKDHAFASKHAETGETQQSFESRVLRNLKSPEYIKKWASYLHDVGFKGQLENAHDK